MPGMTSFLYTGNNLRTYLIDVNGVGYPRTRRSEDIQYTFPNKINVKSYSMKYTNDSFPVRWFFVVKTPQNTWKILDEQSFIDPNTGYTLDPTFNKNGYTKVFNDFYQTDSVMLIVDVCTGTSLKLREFLVYDEFGVNRHVLIPFCTSTNSLYHTGSLNFSQLDSCSIESDLNTDFFAVNHNFLVIENGMGDVMYH